MLLAHKVELRPTEEQKEYFNKCCGTVRHCYNQLLERFSQKENPFSLQAANAFYREIRATFEMLRHFIEYKAKLRKCVVVIADRFFPNSKTCSRCGTKKQNLTLADRIFSCDCGLVIDRDLNAAIMLNNYSRDPCQRDFTNATRLKINQG
jgi:hypothetical protein